MKKKSKNTNRRGKSKASAPPSKPVEAAPSVSRRALMTKLGWGGAALAIGGGAVFFGARSVTAKMAEFDLSRVGQGLPSIVQIHDPTCPSCTALQRQARKALRDMDSDGLIYLVADIKTQDGQAFAAQYGVPHVTLLLFDGAGTLVETLQGQHEAEVLIPEFQALLR